MATVVVWCILPLGWPRPLSVSVPCLPLNCSHLACIISSTPLQIHMVSLQSSPDRTSVYRGSYSFLVPVQTLYDLSCGFLVPHLFVFSQL